MCHAHNGQEEGRGDALIRPFHFPGSRRPTRLKENFR